MVQADVITVQEGVVGARGRRDDGVVVVQNDMVRSQKDVVVVQEDVVMVRRTLHDA